VINLFPDQAAVIDQTRAAMLKSKSVLIQAATGFGKTVLTASMVQGTIKKGTTSTMVVPRRELLRQTSETYTKFEIPHSYVAAGFGFDPNCKTLIATAGSLARRLDVAPVPQVLFVDETHFGAGQLDGIIAHYKERGSWIVGLSATPERLDGRGLGCWYDAMVQGPPTADLIERGRLSKFRMFAPDTPDMTGIRKTAGDYARGQLSDKMEGDRVLIGNAVKHYRAHAMGTLNVTFCVSVNHAEIVAKAFRENGIPAAAIYGAMKDDERAALIKAFARRELLVLTSVDLLIFGFDLASAAQMDVSVESISDLAPTESLSKQMQKWGRSLRAKDFPAIILDHAGNAGRHGLPDQARDWTLDDRPKAKSNSEPTQPIRQCDHCYFVHRPSPECPNCGFAYPVADRSIKEIEGDLKEIEQVEKRQERQAQGRAETLQDLISLAERTGKKKSWAIHVWNARQRKKTGVR
jgi:DNA repair protein RadD